MAIFHGDTGIQVVVSDAELLAHGRPGAELHIIKGMNHGLKTVPADRAQQIASYGDPSLPVSPELIDSPVSFLRRSMPPAASP